MKRSIAAVRNQLAEPQLLALRSLQVRLVLALIDSAVAT
jgi:hypothetical protein